MFMLYSNTQIKCIFLKRDKNWGVLLKIPHKNNSIYYCVLTKCKYGSHMFWMVKRYLFAFHGCFFRTESVLLCKNGKFKYFIQNIINMTKTCNLRYARLFCTLIRLQRKKYTHLHFHSFFILLVCLYPLQKTLEP